MTSDLRDRPIFICGHPKAGTSLLRAIFDSHPQLIVYPEETVFFRRFLPLSIGLDLPGQLALAEETLIHIFRWRRDTPVPSQAGFPDRDYSALSYERINQAMRQLAGERCRHAGDILSAAVLAYGQVSGLVTPDTRGWVEKSPYNEYYAEQIFTWWPEALCIHILRDPRDNYVSYRRKHPDWQAEFFAANWRRSTRAGQANQKRFGPLRYHTLRYEDLAQSPEDTLRRLTGFLHIDWDTSLAAPTRAGEQWAGNSMFAEQFRGISAAPVARWREKLSLQDAAVIERMAGQQMDDFRYPCEIDGAAALAARGRALAWPLRRRLARLLQPAPTQDHTDDRLDD
jgi:protein-tyrosine sulfotransferase